MAAATANTSKPKAWGQLTVRKSTEQAIDALRSQYMRRHGADISEDDIVQALLIGRTVKDLPAPVPESMAGK
jgi:hypothetical protein